MKILVDDENPDIILVTETWLDCHYENNFIGLGDYNIHRKDREEGLGGGVMICIKKHILCNELNIETDKEVCFIDIKTSNSSLRIGIVYRPPTMTTENSTNLCNVLRNQLENSRQYVVFGDFNFPGINWLSTSPSNMAENYFLNILDELGAFQMIEEPTTEYLSLLDLCLTPNVELVSDISVGDCFATSDHCIISCNINLPQYKKNDKIEIKKFQETDWDMVRAHTATMNWDTFFDDCDNVFQMWDKFKHSINNLINLYVPTEIRKKKSTPWFQKRLKSMRKTKMRKWNKYRNSKCNRHLEEYKTFAREYQREINKSKATYEENKFKNKNKKPKQFFNFIKNTTQIKDDVCSINYQGNVCESDVSKCKALSQLYKTVYTEDNQIFPDCNQKMPADSLTHLVITEDDVVKSIRNMNGDSSPGIDNLYTKFLKNISSYLVKPLHKMFSESMQSGSLPDDWVTSIIVPVYKKNRKPMMCASYRPINLTSCVSKILERIIHQNMLSYLRENDLISNAQHGFLSKKSTITNLLTCTFDWVSYFNNKQAIDIVYIDYEKAFDKVCHSKLFYKLQKMGIGGELLEWIKVFIGQRRQTVRLNKSTPSSKRWIVEWHRVPCWDHSSSCYLFQIWTRK